MLADSLFAGRGGMSSKGNLVLVARLSRLVIEFFRFIRRIGSSLLFEADSRLDFDDFCLFALTTPKGGRFPFDFFRSGLSGIGELFLLKRAVNEFVLE